MQKRTPPIMLPRVTGIRFLVNISATVISAPRIIPNGIMNILAIEWSIPMAAKAEMGNQIAVIFPTMVAHPEAMYTAIHTNQLHRIPRTNATSKGKEHLAVAIAADAGPLPRVPLLKQR